MQSGVLVYRYQFWDEETQWRRISALYATEETIRNGLGVVLHHTVLEVDPASLHGTGLYNPLDDSSRTGAAAA